MRSWRFGVVVLLLLDDVRGGGALLRNSVRFCGRLPVR